MTRHALMPTDEPKSPPQEDAGTAYALARLVELLPTPSPSTDPADLTTEQLAAWKPLIERTAFEDGPRADELARLLVAVAEAVAAPGMLALARWTAGNVSFLLDRPLEALAAFEQAEALYRARGEALQIARMSVSVVSALDKAGRYQEAIRRGQAALPILAASAEAADQRRVMSLYNGIGISSEHVGRYAEALEAYERKWRWWRDRAGDAARIETARSLINIGVVNARLGQYTEAHEAFTEAHCTLTTVAPTGQTRYDAARCAMNLAWLESLRRSASDIVQKAFVQARAARAAADPQGDATDLALLDLFEAEWLAESERVEPGLKFTLMALHKRLAANGLAFEAARARLLLARLALLDGDWARAQEEYAALAEAATARGDPETAYLAGVGGARACRAAGDFAAGRQALETVIAAVEGMRAGLLVEEHRAAFRDWLTEAMERNLQTRYLPWTDSFAGWRVISAAIWGDAGSRASVFTTMTPEMAAAKQAAIAAAGAEWIIINDDNMGGCGLAPLQQQDIILAHSRGFRILGERVPDVCTWQQIYAMWASFSPPADGFINIGDVLPEDAYWVGQFRRLYGPATEPFAFRIRLPMIIR